MSADRQPERGGWWPVVIQAVAVALVVIAVVGLAVWFFFFAGSPLPSG